MKKTIITLVILAIVLGGGYYFYRKGVKQAKAPGQNTQDLSQKDEKQNLAANEAVSAPQNLNATSTTPKNSQTPGVASQGTFSPGSEGEMGPDILVSQVSFSGSSFSPALLNIKVGDIVVFKNNSQENFWPASNPHPIHTDYPEFDSKQSIPPGGKYQFKFTKIGNWGYHDHLNPSIGGVVNVSN